MLSQADRPGIPGLEFDHLQTDIVTNRVMHQTTDLSQRMMSRPVNRFDFSDRHAWPTSHLEQLLDAINREIEIREAEEPLSLSRGLSEALQEFLESRNTSG